MSRSNKSMGLEGEGATLKCFIHGFATTDPVEFHQHVFNNQHTETGSRQCEIPGCNKVAIFNNKPMLDRAICKDCNSKIEGSMITE